MESSPTSPSPQNPLAHTCQSAMRRSVASNNLNRSMEWIEPSKRPSRTHPRPIPRQFALQGLHYRIRSRQRAWLQRSFPTNSLQEIGALLARAVAVISPWILYVRTRNYFWGPTSDSHMHIWFSHKPHPYGTTQHYIQIYITLTLYPLAFPRPRKMVRSKENYKPEPPKKPMCAFFLYRMDIYPQIKARYEGYRIT